MRNVYKGFKFSTRAVPMEHMKKVNSMFQKMHAPSLRRPALHIDTRAHMPKMPTPPGRYPHGKR